MKSNFHKTLFTVVFLAFAFSSAGQTFDTLLLSRVKNLTRLSDIIKEADQFFNARIKQQNSSDPYFKQSKLFHRWALYMSNPLVGQGDVTDVNRRNYEAFKKMGLSLNDNTTAINKDINSSYGSWGFIGPTSVNSSDNRLGIGRCDRITFHPSDPNTIYIGTPAGGLWRTTDDGGSWTSLTSNLPTLSISGIVVSYNNPSIIYVLTGDGDSDIGGFVETFGYMRSSTGVYKSVDGGATWSETGPLASVSYTAYRLVQDPNEPNTLLAATSDGIYRTTNGGSTWTRETAASRFYDIEYDPNDADRVYAGGNGQVLYSTNSGDTWTAATFDFSISGQGRVELAVTPNNTSYVYALTGSVPMSGAFSGLYRSTNNGASFTRRCNTPNIMDGSQDGSGNGTQAGYDLTVVASPSNANRVLTGGVNIWSSTDGGATMSAIMYDGSNNRKIHVDIHDMKYNPLNGALNCANDGGLYKSTDNGSTWTKKSDGIGVSQIYHMAGVPGNTNVIATGMQDNGVNCRTTITSSFNHNATGDGYAVAIKGDDVTNGYTSINKKAYTLSLTGGVGNEFGPLDEWYPTIAIHPSTSSTVYVGYTDIYKSTNGGADFTNKSSNGSWSMIVCPSNTSRVYAAGGGNGYSNDANGLVRRSDNGGDSWTTVFSSANATFNKVTHVTVDPTNSDHVWITLGGYNAGEKVYRSLNAGSTWTNVSGSLPNIPVNCVAVDGNNNAYIGTDFGVFYRGTSQTNWTPFFTNMPRVPVTDLMIYESSNLIRAATFGRGIYSTSLYSNCVSDLTLNSSYAGNDYYEAGSTISSTGSITGGAGTQVFFKAGTSVTLGVGFTAVQGNEFKAYLGSCGNGVPVMAASDYQTAAVVPPTDLPYATYGSVEVYNVSGSSCDLNVNVKNAANLKLALIDEAGNLLYQSSLTNKISASTLAERLNYDFQKGKKYKVFLLADNAIVHWQEINP